MKIQRNAWFWLAIGFVLVIVAGVETLGRAALAHAEEIQDRRERYERELLEQVDRQCLLAFPKGGDRHEECVNGR